jgi:hypothetical protein
VSNHDAYLWGRRLSELEAQEEEWEAVERLAEKMDLVLDPDAPGMDVWYDRDFSWKYTYDHLLRILMEDPR